MRNRINWLDTSKGIAILLMIVGHTSIPPVISNFIWAFHMPLFFIASGWTTNWQKTHFKVFTKRKARALIVPFVIYSVIVLIIQISQGWNGFMYWVSNGWIAYALWFIPVLFLASICTYLVYSVKSKYFHLVCALIFALLGVVLGSYEIQLPWTLSSLPIAVFMIILGTELSRFSSIVTRSKPWQVLLLFLITLVVSHFWKLDLCFNIIKPFVPLMIGAIAGTLMIFMLSSKIDKHFKTLSIILQRVGKETYLLVAFSQIIIMLLNEYFSINFVLKYAILLLTVVMLKYMKNRLNKLAKASIL